MLNLKDLGQPSLFWDYFEQISKIPRCSEHEERIRGFIKEEAEGLGFKTQIDKAGNLVIKIPSKTMEVKRVILQSHMDMVCEKNESVVHDFSNDPLNLEVLEVDNEKWITAKGTTLGADNSVGICYSLALMKKIHDGELNIGQLGIDLLFTVDEEMGLRGAFKIDKTLIDGDFLINLDGEEENSVIVGCAGGRVTFFHIKTEMIKIDKKEDLIPIKIFVSGLVGGHSGADIHLGRGNALKIIGQVLWKLNNKYKIHLNSINGGNRTNAIPREIKALLFIRRSEKNKIKTYIQDIFTEIKAAYEGIEPKLVISIEELEYHIEDEVLTKKIQDYLLNILYTIPNGPLSMHPRIKGLVFTSSNLAVIKTEVDKIVIKLSQRSLSEYYKITIWEKAVNLFNLIDLDINIDIDSDISGWTPDFSSRLLAITKDAYKELNGREIKVKAIHAGLECGILGKKFPRMEMISIGPKIIGAHSPDERVSVKSVQKIWSFLILLLEKLC
ncbi:MAG: beta-Ala-His dipeptidase [Promethearchaeota archaeon]